MKSKAIYFLIFFAILLMFLFVYGKDKNVSNKTNTISANKINAEITVNNTNNTINNEFSHASDNTVNEIRIGAHEALEEELASFSTKLGGKVTPRSRNIGITTSTLDGTQVHNGETFSFCKTIGKPTAEKGYEEADSFDADGKTVKTLGGGNCQVSSTLYNVVLQVNDLQVKERHAHSKEVHYVEKDKDAAVSYGSVDFKFKNNTRKHNKNLCKF